MATAQRLVDVPWSARRLCPRTKPTIKKRLPADLLVLDGGYP